MRDVEAAVMPEWLAELLATACDRHPPQGGKVRAAVDARVTDSWHGITRRQLTEQYSTGSSEVSVAELQGLLKLWADASLDSIRVANRHGGWNDAIYRVTLSFAEYGWSWEKVLPAVLAAAAPDTPRDKSQALATMRSAWKKACGVNPPRLDVEER